MRSKTLKSKLVEGLYAIGFYAIFFFIFIAIIEGWSTGYHSNACDLKQEWEATGHDYVGIPYESRNCN